jgi:hypothetical protein
MKPSFDEIMKNDLTLLARTASQIKSNQMDFRVNANQSMGIDTYCINPATDEVEVLPIAVAISRIGQQGDTSSKKFYQLFASEAQLRDKLDLKVYEYHLDSASECAATDYEWNFALPTYETSTRYGAGNVEGNQDGDNRVFRLTNQIISADGLFFAINGVEIRDYSTETAALHNEKWVHTETMGEKTPAPVEEDDLYCDGAKLLLDGVEPSSEAYERFTGFLFML